MKPLRHTHCTVTEVKINVCVQSKLTDRQREIAGHLGHKTRDMHSTIFFVCDSESWRGGGRKGGREGRRGGRGGREGGEERWRGRGGEEGREGRREGGKEGGKEEGRDGRKEEALNLITCMYMYICCRYKHVYEQ